MQTKPAPACQPAPPWLAHSYCACLPHHLGIWAKHTAASSTTAHWRSACACLFSTATSLAGKMQACMTAAHLPCKPTAHWQAAPAALPATSGMCKYKHQHNHQQQHQRTAHHLRPSPCKPAPPPAPKRPRPTMPRWACPPASKATTAKPCGKRWCWACATMCAKAASSTWRWAYRAA